MSLSSFFSSFLPTTFADAPADETETKADAPQEEPEDVKETDAKEEPEAQEEEEEEPEDILPSLREECQESAKCAPLTKHFQHCQEKIEAGNGFKHEDCVEELMMHCVDGCVAPKLFSKLR